MKFDIKNLIQACNNCILSCEQTIRNCEDSCLEDAGEECSVSCQQTIDACYKCIHECNQALENNWYETFKQKSALEKCIEACRKGAKGCNISTNKVLSQEAEGCEWAKDSLNECISACDECIESFER